jgi:hypothetical protein
LILFGDNEAMRKTVVCPAVSHEDSAVHSVWLDLVELARVEVTSEEKDHPIEAAFGDGAGWRAASPGRQLIRIIFDTARPIHRIALLFDEAAIARTQEFSLRWSAKTAEGFREIVRQQWNFDPNGSTVESEDYRVNLQDVSVLELNINPDIGSTAAYASLACWRVG